ncbi:MAG: lipocalin-like domain-containing protein [Burkholderiales bacterium]
MKRRGVILAIATGAAALARGGAAHAADRAAEVPSTDARYAAVQRGQTLSFPRDHGAHPDFRTEWWYVTGHLQRAGLPDGGFQVTFFRSRTTHADANPSRFAPKQLLFAHAALALPERARLLHEDRAARSLPGRVRASEADTDVALDGWTFTRDAASDSYRARITGRELEMTLDLAPAGAPLLQGENGYSQKGPRPEQASWYYSRPQLTVTGSIATARPGRDAGGRAERIAVTGRAWLDHEWSSTLLDERASGWDWIGINLDDGGSLMAFRIRTREGGILWSHAVQRDAQGRVVVVDAGARWQEERWWTSPRSQARYPVAFALRLAGQAYVLKPLMEDQEIDARASTGGYYWEGAVTLSSGARTLGRGYLELTGYAGRVRL